MGGPEVYRSLPSTVAALVLTLGCAAGLIPPAKNPAPASLPPQTLNQSQPEEAPPAATPVPTPTPSPTVVVVEPGGEESAPDNLVAAARAEKERRRTLGPPVAVLHDKNIQDFAKNQKLTFANPETEPTQGGAKAPTSPAQKDEESYWRERGRHLRERWRSLNDELGDLRHQTADLRVRFYNTDDPYIRDAEVKPAWDRALDRIDRVEREIVRIQEDLERFLEEGQRGGALPAWLLEGIDLEPEPEPLRGRPAEPGEPVIYEEKPL